MHNQDDRPILPEGFIYLDALAPEIAVDLRYACSNNFVGSRIDGYHANLCIVRLAMGQALQRVQQWLRADGMGLLILDTYRPHKALRHFARWQADVNENATKAAYYPNLDKAMLYAAHYLSHRSQHTRGSAVDLTLRPLEAPGGWDLVAEPVAMGTGFDFFDPRSHTASRDIPQAAQRNRARLCALMAEAGFENYPLEWWHFSLDDDPNAPLLDFDVGRPSA